MKFSVIILFILVTMTLILVPLRTCQENEDKHLMFMPSENLGYEHSFIEGLRRTTAKPCPEGERQDSKGRCRKPL